MLSNVEVERINKIKESLCKITEGKWEVRDEDNEEPCIVSVIDGKETYICQTTYDGLSLTCEHNIVEDTEFIANSKENIKFLLHILERELLMN